MSGTPKYKCFRGKEYVAACKYPEDAAVLLSADVIDRVSYDRAVWVWTEADDTSLAANSYDDAAEVMQNRIRQHNIKVLRSMGKTDQQIIDDYGHSPDLVEATQ